MGPCYLFASKSDRTMVLLETSDKIIQKYEPGFMKSLSKYGRASLYAPYKRIGNHEIDTYVFNALILWIKTFILYIALYYKLLQKAITFVENMRVPTTDK